jgi:hypothetical protein
VQATLGLGAFLWAAFGLPALHTFQHAAEEAADAAEEARAVDVHVLLREIIAASRHTHTHTHATAPAHHHHHRDDHDGAPGTPGGPDPRHGHDSQQHFSVALLANDPPVLPPVITALDILSLPALPGRPATCVTCSPRSSRGPPVPAA